MCTIVYAAFSGRAILAENCDHNSIVKTPDKDLKTSWFTGVEVLRTWNEASPKYDSGQNFRGCVLKFKTTDSVA